MCSGKSKGLGERHTGFQLVLQCTATQPQANGLSFARLANRIVILLLQGVMLCEKSHTEPNTKEAFSHCLLTFKIKTLS